MSRDGPTQSRVRAGNNEWAARSALSWVVRVVVMLAPTVASFVAVFYIRRRWSPEDLGLHVVVYWVGLFSIGFLVLWAVDKAARRFLPLAALFRLSLIFPDEAPSRFAVAMRTGTTRQLERRIKDIQQSGLTPEETRDANTMLELVAALSTHDRLTRGHCERVRAYTDLIAEEMHLHDDDIAKLRWAALLHDVGKLFVPYEILNAEGRPTDEEWEVLKSHTWKGDELIDPLRDWLGPWANAVRSHHERWDGNGYPDRLADHEIPLGARIVAVADAYDVMTSKRSYKEPRPAAEARAEVAACAGSHFDPEVARAFLNIGLGRLRMAAGPLSWLANLPGTGGASVAPAGVQVISTGGAAASTAAAAIATLAAGGLGTGLPSEVAFTAPPVVVASETTVTTLPQPPDTVVVVSTPTTTTPQPTTTLPPATPTTAPPPGPVALETALMATEDLAVSLALWANGNDRDVVFSIVDPPRLGVLDITGEPTSSGRTVSLPARYTPAPNASGVDTLTFQVCPVDDSRACSRATATIVIQAVNDTPRAAAESATTAEDTPFVAADAFLLSNDFDADGDTLTVRWGTPSVPGVVLSTADGGTSILPPLNFAGLIELPYQACDALACSSPTSLTLSVTAVNDAPSVAGEVATLAEDTVFSHPTSWFLANDTDVEGDALELRWTGASPAGTFTTDDPVTYAPPRDHVGPVLLTYIVCDPTDCSTPVSAELTYTPVDDPPTISGAHAVTAVEDFDVTVTHADLMAVIDDPDTGVDDLAFTFTAPGVGALTIDAGGFTYTPVPDSTALVSIGFEVCDLAASCASGTIDLTFTAVDDPPTITGTTFTATEDTTLSVSRAAIEALVTDVDTPAADLTLAFATAGDGTLTPDGLGGFTYTPAPDSTSGATIDIEVCDATSCATATSFLTVTAVNDAPKAIGEARTIDEDTLLSEAVTALLANDTDAEGDALTIAWGSPSVPGGTFTPGDPVTYQPPLDHTATITIPYQVCDATLCSTSVDLTIAISPIDDPPTVTGTVTIPGVENSATTVTNADILSAVVDVDTPPGALTFVWTVPPTGTFVPDPGDDGFTYTAPLDSNDPVMIDYDVCDAGSCASGTVELTFTPVDSPPVASDVGFTIDEDTTLTLTRAMMEPLVADPDTAAADIVFGYTDPGTGTLVEDGLGGLDYTPALDNTSPVSIAYEACDATTCDTATITITITPLNDAPRTTAPPSPLAAVFESPVTLIQDYTAFDPEGDPITMNVVTADNGTISVVGADVVFTPDDGFTGITTVVFELCDATACLSDPVNSVYTISVAPNQDPDFPAIADQNVWVGVPINLGPFPATDPEGRTLTYTQTAFPPGLTLNPVPGGFTLTGTITDPSYLGSNHLIHIDADDPDGGSVHQHFDLVFSDQGLSPFAGDVLITEVLAQNVVICIPIVGCLPGEAFELHNPTAAPVDLTGWSVVDYAPGTGGEPNRLRFDLLGPINAGEWRGHDTAFESNPIPYNFNADDIWLLDADGLVVDYVAWNDGSGAELLSVPDAALNIWDPAGMAEIAGLYDPSTATTIALATLTDANSAACWEFTTSGNASSGTSRCAAADTFVTYDNPAAENPLFDPAWLHSWGAANFS